MQESQQKRKEFRKQIRRRHINQLFTNIRNAHKERQRNSTVSSESASPEQKKQIRVRVQQFVQKCIIHYQGQDYEALGKEAGEMGKLVEVMPETVTACLDDELKQHGALLIDNIRKDVSKAQLEKIGSHVGTMGETGKQHKKIPTEAKLNIVNQVLNLSSRIKYQKFGQESAILILKALWNVLDSGYHLPELGQAASKQKQEPQKIANYHYISIITNLCVSLSSILDSPHHNLMKKHLNKLGLPPKLSQIIQISINFPIRTHQSLLRLLYLFNSPELGEGAQDNLINGISIISNDSAFKEKYAVYCIYFVLKNWPELHELALLTLNHIFEENPYFIDSIKTNYYGRVLELVLDSDRKVNVAALRLLATLAFYSPSASDELVEKNSILDCIHDRLRMEAEMVVADPDTKQSITKCTNILCDLLLTKDQKIKKLLFNHHIWELLYRSIQEGNRLFSTVIAFKFFFSSISRKERNQILPSFLEAVSRLSLQNELVPQIKQIKQTLYNVFYHSMEHNSEQGHEEIIRLYETNNLMKYIQDFQASLQLQQ